MLSYTDLDEDQHAAVDRLYEHDHTLLIAPTGAGKTVVTLTAIDELISEGILSRVLVIAPLKVANNVWQQECENWSHLAYLGIGIATGDQFDGVLVELYNYDIVVVNFDMVPKLVETGLIDKFDGLVVDEGSKMAAGGVWFKKLRKYIKLFKWRLVMSATPITEGWEKLFYQTFLVDNGETFGRNKMQWQQRYFYSTDFNQYNWAVIPGQDKVLAEMVEPLVHVMPDYKRDTLPPFTVERIDTPLPPAAMKSYREMAGKFSTEGVLAETAAAKVQKLQQIASGFIYDKDKEPITIHSAKFDALADLVSDFDSNFLIVYQYVEQLRELRERFPELVTLDDDPQAVERWNNGEIRLLCLHALSGGHGLNLQHGGHDIIWLAPIRSLDQFQQTNERLWRRGQVNPVTAYVLVAPDTVDELVLLRHKHKAAFMPALLDHLEKVRVGNG